MPETKKKENGKKMIPLMSLRALNSFKVGLINAVQQ
jgi:hypothetical protein